MLAALAAVSAGAFGAPAPVLAEEQPPILKAYNLDWIERIKEEAWPQPKAQRPVICLLDTGVSVTPDTPADNPEGPIVARLALDGGTGEAQGDDWEHRHGTQMASVIAAPRNNWGTVGVFPQARIVSVRVTQGTALYITPADVEGGTHACAKWVEDRGMNLAVVMMAESLYDHRASDTTVWETAAGKVEAAGAVLVAAVGNDPTAATAGPAVARGVIPVAAGDISGALCPFLPHTLSRGIVAPGCDDGRAGSWIAGSSAATATVAAVAAVVKTQRPTASTSDLAVALEATSVPGPQNLRTIRGDLVRTALFLPDMILPNAGDAPLVGTTVVPDPSRSAPAPTLRMFKPSARVSWKSGRLHVRWTDRRRAGRRLVVAVKSRTGRTVVPGPSGRSKWSFPLVRRPQGVSYWVEGGSTLPWRSLSRRARVARK